MILIVSILLLYTRVKTKKNLVEEDIVLPLSKATNEDYYITRPNGKDDGGTVRVMFMIASNRIDWTLCYAVASAYFTNIPIVVAKETEMMNFKGVYKPSIYLSAIDKTDLHDSDVVIALDADIMFTGADFLPFIDKFIKLSPASLTELDAKAIRTGKAMAPSIYGSEKNCYAPQTLSEDIRVCISKYEEVNKAHKVYEDTLSDDVKPFFNYDYNSISQLNSGTSIHRVWSLRKLFAAFHTFMAVNKPLDNREWWCDQSVFTKLYLELRQWEIEQDYFRKSTKQLQVMRNEYGLYAGMLGLDLIGEMSILVPPSVELESELTSLLWLKNHNTKEHSILLQYWKIVPFVNYVYEQARKHVSKLFTQRKLTRSYSNVHSVTIAPPLLSIVPRHINGKDKPAERVYPPLIHFAGTKKFRRERRGLNYMQWSLPMMFNEEDWKRGKQYVMSMPIELWTDTNDKLRLLYGDVCNLHPFSD